MRLELTEVILRAPGLCFLMKDHPITEVGSQEVGTQVEAVGRQAAGQPEKAVGLQEDGMQVKVDGRQVAGQRVVAVGLLEVGQQVNKG